MAEHGFSDRFQFMLLDGRGHRDFCIRLVGAEDVGRDQAKALFDSSLTFALHIGLGDYHGAIRADFGQTLGGRDLIFGLFHAAHDGPCGYRRYYEKDY